MSNVLDLHLFGGFHLEDSDGEVVSVPLRKGEALLAYLAASVGKTASRERLATLLWGESEQQRARQSLRQVLFALTREFARNDVSILRMESQLVALDPTAIWVDVSEFESLAETGTPEALSRAVTLYKGDFLAGLGVEAPGFEDWLSASRSRYQDMAMKVATDLLALQETAGDVETAIETAVWALRLDPFREDLHRHLMKLYVAKAMRSSALTQYRTCKALLARELEVAPDEETTALYKKILEQESEFALDSTALAPPLAASAPTEDFSAKGVFLGRKRELGILEEQLSLALADSGRCVAIVGEGGVGRSSLGERFAADLLAQGHGVVTLRARASEQPLGMTLWADLLNSARLAEGGDGAGQLSPAARHELALFKTSGDGSERRRLFDAAVDLIRLRSRQRPTILVLDDLQWADEESLRLFVYVARRIREDPVLLVATVLASDLTRRPLISDVLGELQGEELLTVVPLGPLSRKDSDGLIRALAALHGEGGGGRLDPAEIWSMSKGNPQVIVDEVLAGISCEEPARQSRRRMPDQIAKDPGTLLAGLSETARRAAMAASVIGKRVDYDLLLQAARLDQAEGVEAIEELVAAGLLFAVGEGLAFTRERIRLAILDELLAPRRRALHADAAEAIEILYAGRLEPHALALAEHFRAAGQSTQALRCELRGARAELHRGALGAARKLLQRVLKATRPLTGNETVRSLEIEAQVILAGIAETEHEFESAMTSLQGLARRFGSIESPRLRAFILAALARLYRMSGQADVALDHARRALAEAQREEAGCLWYPAEYLIERLHLVGGAYDEATDRLDRRRRSAHDLALREDEADAAATQGIVSGLRGDFDSALSACGMAVSITEGIANERCLAVCLQALGMVQAWSGAYIGALSSFDRAGQIAEVHGDLLRLYSLSGHRAYALAGAKRFDESVTQFQSAIDMARDLNTRTFSPLFRAWMAETLFEADARDEALHHAREAFRLAAEANQPWARSVALRSLARVLGHTDVADLSGASKAIRSALADQEGLGIRFEQARSLVVHAKVLRASGNLRLSSEVYARASEMFGQMQMTGDFDSARNMAEALRPSGQ